MDIITDPNHSIMVMMKSARVGYTKGCVTAPIGYWMAQDPASVLLLQPTDFDAEGYSKEDIEPMLRDCSDVSTVGVRGTLLDKTYPGGSLHLRGVNSAKAFRRLTVAKVLFDEVDAFPLSAAGEGDPITLGMKRAEDAEDPMFVIGSSPRLEKTSIIVPLFERSDQRHFNVPCPHCDFGQVLKWGGPEYDYGIKYDKDDPESAWYLCAHCHCTIDYSQQWGMVEQGHYEATNEGGEFPGFHIWAAYSNLPQATWGHMARAWVSAQGKPELLQVFVNTWLGEAYQEAGESPKEEKLRERAERYALRDGAIEGGPLIPDGVAVLTAGIDVQLNRIETHVVGWGSGEECWPVEYSVIFGDPTGAVIWQEIAEFLSRARWYEVGGVDYIRSTCIDAGYASQSVYKFVSDRPMYATQDGNLAYTWAIMGGRKKGPVFPTQASKSAMANVPMYMLNEIAAKDELYGRLDSIDKAGPKYIHMPEHFEDSWYRQLVSEQVTQKRDKRGYAVREYSMKKGHTRNESLDTWGYSYAALCALYMRGFDLEGEVARVKQMGLNAPQHPEQTPQAAAPTQTHSTPTQRTPTSGGYLSGGRKRGGWLG